MVGNSHDLDKDKRLHLQNYRNLDVRIEVLDKENNVLDTIEGIVNGGSININGSSAIRRTGSISMILTDKVTPKDGGVIWITNKIRIYIGIRDNASLRDDYTKYCIGTFYIDEATASYSQASNELSLDLSDYMAYWEDKQIDENFKIEAGIPIHIAILNVMNMFEEFNTEVEMTDLDVPQDLDFQVGDTVLDAIQQIRDLYMDYDCYYTVDGKFVFKRLKVQLEGEEEVKWRFGQGEDLMINMSKSSNFKNVKNSIMVVGKTEEDGNFVSGNYLIEDVTNPFHKDNIGERKKVVTDSSLFTTAQCESMAIYELFKSANFGEKFSITCVPIYFLDANSVVEVYNSDKEVYEQILVNNISYGFDVNATMTIDGSKMYYNIYNINKIPIDYYRAVADSVIESVKKYGWLSIPEARIYQMFGLQGRGGANVRLRFQYQESGGVTAYVIGFETHREQSMVLDLADFQYAEGSSGAQNGVGKGDYLDRVIGHEVLHLVMNDDFGVTKTSKIPEWYKEGLAELLHGADERLKILIENEDGNGYNEDSITKIVNGAYNIAKGNRQLSTTTEDYASSYVILKVIAQQLSKKGVKFSEFHDRIRLSTDSGDKAFRQAVTYYFGAYENLAELINTDGVQFVKNMALNFGQDEIDTGSIGGSDYGNPSLNAEDVFNNLQAEENVLLKKFNVIIERP